MAKTKARLGAGDVEIELDGEIVTLRPTLRAMQTISRQRGGIVTAAEAVGRLDFDAMVQVIKLGLDTDTRDIPEKVWRTGLGSLSGPLIRYLTILSNGGRPIDGGEASDGENPPVG